MPETSGPGRVKEAVIPEHGTSTEGTKGGPEAVGATDGSKAPSAASDRGKDSTKRITGPTIDPPKPVPPESSKPSPAPEISKQPWWLSLFWLIISFVGVWSLGGAALKLAELWREQPIVALPVSVGAVVIIILLARTLWLEWLALRDLDALSERQRKMEEALNLKDINRLKSALKPTLEALKAQDLAPVILFEKSTLHETNCNRYIERLDAQVLRPLDEKAADEVRNGALSVAAAVAIIPHSAFDAAVVLWRALLMIRRISAIYGLRPGGLATWRLLTHTIKSALLAVGISAIGAMLADASANTIARLAKPIAEGAVVGVRIYHLGRLCVDICRPVQRESRDLPLKGLN